MAELTDREMAVLELIGQGKTMAQVARKLGISRGGAKTRAHHLYRKLGAVDRAQAVDIAHRRGLFPGTPAGRVRRVLDAHHVTRELSPDHSLFALFYDEVAAAFGEKPT